MRDHNSNAVLIACSMLRNEIEKAMKECGVCMPVIWMEKGLHEKPAKLRQALQKQIDMQQNKSYILLGYCLCGNATIGLHSEKATLIIPKFDDCIRMLLSNTENSAPDVNNRCLYFTKGWIDSDKFIMKEKQQYTEKYGAQKSEYIMNLMLENYIGLRLIDTGMYKISDCLDEAKAAAEELHLDFDIVKGTIRVLNKLFRNKHDMEFCIIPRGATVSEDHFSDRAI